MPRPESLKKRLWLLALLFFLFALAGLLASAFVAYGLYILFWMGFGSALTCVLFACLLRREPSRLKSWIVVVALLQIAYVGFSVWQSSLERAQRVDWIWFFPCDFAAFGGLVAAIVCYWFLRRVEADV
jgi:hypothetical protein